MQESEIVEWDYSYLRGKIIEKYGKYKNFVTDSKIMSYATFNDKIQCRKEFKQSEIIQICNSLNIDTSDIIKYFFTLKV